MIAHLVVEPGNDPALSCVDRVWTDRLAVMPARVDRDEDMSSNHKLTNRTAESGTRIKQTTSIPRAAGLDLSLRRSSWAHCRHDRTALGSQLSVVGTVARRALASIIACGWLAVYGFPPSYA